MSLVEPREVDASRVPLRILPGGRLEHTRWHQPGDEPGAYLSTDVTRAAADFIWTLCAVHPDATLGDAAALLTACPGLCVALGPGARMLLDELGGGARSAAPDLEAVEVYWSVQQESDGSGLAGNALPGFHGVGRDGVRYALDFSDPDSLIGLPLRLSHDYPVWDEAGPVVRLRDPEYALGQVLYAIVRELTWYGTAEERRSAREELKRSLPPTGGGCQ